MSQRVWKAGGPSAAQLLCNVLCAASTFEHVYLHVGPAYAHCGISRKGPSEAVETLRHAVEAGHSTGGERGLCLFLDLTRLSSSDHVLYRSHTKCYDIVVYTISVSTTTLCTNIVAQYRVRYSVQYQVQYGVQHGSIYECYLHIQSSFLDMALCSATRQRCMFAAAHILDSASRFFRYSMASATEISRGNVHP